MLQPTTATAFPGFDSPGVGFGQPFEMLEACHERVQRSLALLGKLVDYIDQHGHDARTQSAAADVLRYFDIAAPLHHEDEEVHVFPPLLAQGDGPLRAAVQRLQGEHQRMAELWAVVRQPLLRWREPGMTEKVDDATRSAVKSLGEIYAGHIATEEGLVYLAARTRMDDAALAGMGQAMQARRRS